MDAAACFSEEVRVDSVQSVETIVAAAAACAAFASDSSQYELVRQRLCTGDSRGWLPYEHSAQQILRRGRDGGELSADSRQRSGGSG